MPLIKEKTTRFRREPRAFKEPLVAAGVKVHFLLKVITPRPIGRGRGEGLLFSIIFSPFQIQLDEIVQTDGLHVSVVNHVETEVHQFAVDRGLTFQDGTAVVFQLVEHLFVDDAVAVDKVFQQGIFLQRLQMFFFYLDASCSRSVGLNLHDVMVLLVMVDNRLMAAGT